MKLKKLAKTFINSFTWIATGVLILKLSQAIVHNAFGTNSDIAVFGVAITMCIVYSVIEAYADHDEDEESINNLVSPKSLK